MTHDGAPVEAAEALAEKLASMSAAKRELFELLRKRRAAESGLALRIPQRDHSVPARLSYAQEQMYFLAELNPGNSAYNRPTAIRIAGPLDRSQLASALSEIKRRHEPLRTVYRVVDDVPVQVIQQPADWPLQQVDLRGVAEPERWSEALRQAGEAARKPFDLGVGVIGPARLWRLAERDHLLLLPIHHIAFDAWSEVVLYRELAELLTAAAEGRAPSLPVLPVQYADYAAFERSPSATAARQAALAWWKQRLEGAPNVLTLPFERTRPAVMTTRGRRRHVQLPVELTEALRSIAHGQEATLFMVLLAAYASLLHRYTGQTDMVLGCATTGRQHAELENLIGDFVNTLPLRIDLAGKPTFAALLQRVKTLALESFGHHDVPLKLLIEELAPARDAQRSPLFQHLFVFQNTPPPGRDAGELSLRPVTIETDSAMLDLIFELYETPAGIVGDLEYNTDLFDDATIGRLLGHWQTLLEGICAAPGIPLTELPLLTAAEIRQLTLDWNATARRFDGPPCVHDWIATQARATPRRCAAIHAGRQMTYQELHDRSNQLARYLRAQGVGPSTLVGFCVERSLDMLVGVLGILKTGAAYVPLDPQYPPQRLDYIVAHSAVAMLLTETALADRFAAAGRQVICLDRDWPRIASEPCDDLPPAATGSDLAYIIYTSGSTGQPKGAAISHAALANLLHSMSEQPGIGPDDVVLAITTLSFDIAALEIYLPLVRGARVIVANHADAADPARLMQLADEHRVSLWQATPATFRMLITAGWSGNPNLKILVGGEALASDLAGQLLERAGEVWNMYGPTETTVWSTIERIKSPDPPISIGRPIANTQAYVLDTGGSLVSVGVPGELYLGGAGLAAGYWNSPELTAERFVTNPLTGDPCDRLYRTGDLVRWLPNGRLEFLGRLDHQLKVRGFRIEPGEIEAALRRHPHVQAAVVVAREGPGGGKRLVAFWVANEGAATGGNALYDDQFRRHLRDYVPDYMVPAAFRRLNRLPLTPNGKVDRRALPALDAARSEGKQAPVPPRTPAEELLTAVWEELLAVEHVSIHDNFFALGGNSLLAVQLFARLHNKLGKALPLATIFKAQTIATLAESIDAELADPADLVQLIRPAGSGETIVWFGHPGPLPRLKQLLPSDHGLIWVEIEGMDGRPPEHATIGGMAAYYAGRVADRIGPRGAILGGFSLGGLMAFEVARQLRMCGLATSLFLVEPSAPGKAHQAGFARLLRHAQHVRHSSRSRLAYFREKSRVVYSRWIERWINRYQCQRLLKAGKPVPPHLRWWYFEPLYMQAMRSFEPESFAGRLTLIRRHDVSRSHQHWTESVAEDFHAYAIAAEHHRETVENPDCVSQWLPHFQEHLQSCQTVVPSQPQAAPHA